jgi:FkbM family methyltransferase
MNEERWHELEAKKQLRRKAERLCIERNHLYSYNRYGVYRLPDESEHRTAVKLILNHKVHEPKTIKAILKYANDGLVIHAGTYFGDMLPAFKHLKRVIAFEPNIQSYKLALETMGINGIYNIDIYNYALWSSRESNLRLTTTSNDKNLGGGSYVGNSGEYAVITTTIDEIMQGFGPTLIHLDVEGSENEALKGGLDTISVAKPVLILERTQELETEWFREVILGKLGYKLKKKIHNNGVYLA